MEYKQIEAFIAIAELKNITKAADTLFVSQSALSYRLKTLEDEIGATLVTRNKGIANICLTTRGEEFLSIAREWEDVYRKALAFSTLTEITTIRIAAPASVHEQYSSLYTQITAESSNARLSVSTYNSAAIPSVVESRDADIGFGFIYRNSPKLLVREIQSTPMVLVERSKTDRRSSAVEPSALDPSKAVLVKGIALDNPDCAAFYKSWFGTKMPFHMYVDSPSLLFKTLPVGGWCILPENHTRRLSEDADFHFYKLKDTSFTLPLYLFLHKEADESLKILIKKYFD
ncbi:HTH-type transcriptional regulator gltC [uncultured Eubacterium sp.]|nr:HTH-type transcriptional regulator gltC [uncultured Eubacterium sp.]